MIQPAREVFYTCDFRCLYNGVHLRVVSITSTEMRIYAHANI